jgi:hypothetical protein
VRELWYAGMQSVICRSVPLDPLSPVTCLVMVIVVVVLLCVAVECGQAARGAQDEVHLGGRADIIVCTAPGGAVLIHFHRSAPRIRDLHACRARLGDEIYMRWYIGSCERYRVTNERRKCREREKGATRGTQGQKERVGFI